MQNLKQLKRGCCHLKRQVENAQAFGLPVIVAVNKFRYNIKQQTKRSVCDFSCLAICYYLKHYYPYPAIHFHKDYFQYVYRFIL